jgi:predicted NUDIX family NTP pyrophosphohydrolase
MEVLLAHPGGPFFARKDDGVWTIPKGEAAPGEDLLTRAQIEFEEEVGFCPKNDGEWIQLGWIKQKGGKIVHAWRLKPICREDSSANQICSNWNGHRAQANTKNFQKSIRRVSSRNTWPDAS